MAILLTSPVFDRLFLCGIFLTDKGSTENLQKSKEDHISTSQRENWRSESPAQVLDDYNSLPYYYWKHLEQDINDWTWPDRPGFGIMAQSLTRSEAISVYSTYLNLSFFFCKVVPTLQSYTFIQQFISCSLNLNYLNIAENLLDLVNGYSKEQVVKNCCNQKK